jgi:hypothetical protein
MNIGFLHPGAMGISLGGMTTTLVAYHPQMGDPRIGAALSIAGPTFVFGEAFFREPSLPFLMLAADDDALVPFADNAAPVLALIPGAQLVTVTGGSHTGFSGPSAPLRWLNNPDALGCYVVMENLGDLDAEPWYEELGTPEGNPLRCKNGPVYPGPLAGVYQCTATADDNPGSRGQFLPESICPFCRRA